MTVELGLSSALRKPSETSIVGMINNSKSSCNRQPNPLMRLLCLTGQVDVAELPEARRAHCFSLPSGACPLKRLSHVVLDRKGVTGVRDVKDLEELCPALKELHLPFNSITDSKDVC